MASGCGGSDDPPRDPPPGDVVDTRTPAPWRAGGELDRVLRTRAAARAAARRRAALAALAGVHTVPAALRRAELRGSISPAACARYRAAYDGARNGGAAARRRARRARSARCSRRSSGSPRRTA